MASKNRPADIRFDEEDGSTDESGGARLALAASGSQIEPDFMDSMRGSDESFDPDEVIESVAPRRKAKPGMPKWILALAVFMLLAVLGGAYLSFAAFKKRSAAVSYDSQVELPASQSSVPQPVIALAAPAERFPGVVAPVQASEPSPASAPVQAVVVPSEAPSSPPRDGAALAVAEANAAEIKKLKSQVDQLATSVNALIAAKDAQPPRQAAPPTAAAKPVVQQAAPAKPSPAPMQKPKASPAREEVLPSYRRDWVISAIVNNRAFVIKKMPDGSEQEMSVVAGDKIDGKLIEAIDGQTKEIKLDGNQRITTGRAR